MAWLKPDCSDALRRKTPQSLLTVIDMKLSPVRFESKNREIPPISCNYHRNPSGFLCTSDCVAEREGFEPPVPFQARRFSRPEPSTTRPPLRLYSFTTFAILWQDAGVRSLRSSPGRWRSRA